MKPEKKTPAQSMASLREKRLRLGYERIQIWIKSSQKAAALKAVAPYIMPPGRIKETK